MNFHSLLHVNAARRAAERYAQMESEVSRMVDLVINNRSFALDKLALKVNGKAPELNIYIGSDHSFCGSMNAAVSIAVEEAADAVKIIVGKKLNKSAPGTIFAMDREVLDKEQGRITEILEDALVNQKYSAINVAYNRTDGSGGIELCRRRLYPIELTSDAKDYYTDDFSVEGGAEELLFALCASHAVYGLMAAAAGSFAAENMLRQNTTAESLKRLDEREAEERVLAAKVREQASFRRVLDSHVKKCFYGG
jgi:F0F1-type ATP synthase gamma subunit